MHLFSMQATAPVINFDELRIMSPSAERQAVFNCFKNVPLANQSAQ